MRIFFPRPLLLLTFLLPSLALADAPAFPASNMKEYIYKTVGDVKLALDVYTPPGYDATKPGPVLIFFHGGGWQHGDKRGRDAHGDGDPHCQYFALRGLVSVSVDYRFMDKKADGIAATKEICDLDGKSAIRWVRSHATDLGIDPARVILGGESAGTQICFIAAMNTTFNDPGDNVSIPTTAIAFLFFNPAFGLPVHTHEDPQLEPYVYITPTLPPVILFCGSKDGWKPPAVSFHDQCQKANAKADMWIAPGEDHAFTNKDEWLQATCRKADPFLVSLGLLAPPPAPLTVPEGTSLVTLEDYVAQNPAPKP